MSKSHPAEKLRVHALKFPEAEEGTSCNKSSFKARKKAYLYLGVTDDSYNLMVKIGPSQGEAKKLQKKYPGCFSLGSGGWIKVEFPSAKSPPAGVLERWIEESYRLLVHKELVAALDEQGLKKAAKKRATKKGAKRATKKVTAKKKPTKVAIKRKAVKKKPRKKTGS